MAELKTSLDLRYIDGHNWLVMGQFQVQSDIVGLIDIPKYFVTDFNSQPRVLHRLLPPTEFGEAAVPHDKMYRDGTYPQEICDKVHREILECLGAPRWKRILYYRGLRMFGGIAYGRYRKMDKLDPLGRRPITDALKADIAKAFDTSPLIKPGKRGALVVVVDKAGPRMHAAACIGNKWQVAGTVGKPWDGPVNGSVEVIAAW